MFATSARGTSLEILAFMRWRGRGATVVFHGSGCAISGRAGSRAGQWQTVGGEIKPACRGTPSQPPPECKGERNRFLAQTVWAMATRPGKMVRPPTLPNPTQSTSDFLYVR